MTSELEALRKWRADAIAKHPDLARVDLAVLRAREIVAKENRRDGETKWAAEFLEGKWDDHVEMRIALRCLREGMVNV